LGDSQSVFSHPRTEKAAVSEDLHGRKFRLADYESVFEAAEQSHIDAVLVGGQAVYFWAMRYRAQCPELDSFQPYTSKDADYLADEEAAEELARTLHSQFCRAPQKGGMLGLSLGYIPLNPEMHVEILGRVNGVKNDNVRAGAALLNWQDKAVRVIHPIQLYIGKGHNLIELDQSHRQDGKHFIIMQWVLRRFLAELAAVSELDATKALLSSCEALIDFSHSDIGLKLIARGHMPQAPLWPDLTSHPSEKVQNFCRERVPRWEQQLEKRLEKARTAGLSARSRAAALPVE
jgi:hypothetical protein